MEQPHRWPNDDRGIEATVLNFARERDWEAVSHPKNLSMALAAETGELMEHFPLDYSEQSKAIAAQSGKRENWEELADVVIYALDLPT